MAVTRLKRKLKKNKIHAAQRQERIKQLSKKPVIKNLSIDELKEAFKNSDSKTNLPLEA